MAALPFTSDNFREVAGCFTTGITLIALTDGDHAVGLTVNSFTSVSLDPPLILWCLQKDSSLRAVYETAGHFSVNILSNEQQDLSINRARPDDHYFAPEDYRIGPHGTPIIKGAHAVLECKTETIHDGGDHLIIIGRVLDLDVSIDKKPLVYYGGQYFNLQHD